MSHKFDWVFWISNQEVGEGRALNVVYMDFCKASDNDLHCRLFWAVRLHGIQKELAKWMQNWLHVANCESNLPNHCGSHATSFFGLVYLEGPCQMLFSRVHKYNFHCPTLNHLGHFFKDLDYINFNAWGLTSKANNLRAWHVPESGIL